MSFTLMYHNKNGVPRPIKMSIWDAFKGAPTPKLAKPQPVSFILPIEDEKPLSVIPEVIDNNIPEDTAECVCCHKIHPRHTSAKGSKDCKETKDSTKKGTKAGKDGDKCDNKHDGKDNNQGPSFSTRNEESYSKKDDKKIIEMKQKNENWKDILDAIGKQSLSQLKAHWKIIDPSKVEGSDSKGGDKTYESSKKDKIKDDAQNKKNEIEKKKADGQGKKKEKAGGSKKKDDTENDAGKDEMKTWSDRYDKQKWIAAASRHFDLTGQRITPAMAKKLAQGE